MKEFHNKHNEVRWLNERELLRHKKPSDKYVYAAFFAGMFLAIHLILFLAR